MYIIDNVLTSNRKAVLDYYIVDLHSATNDMIENIHARAIFNRDNSLGIGQHIFHLHTVLV